MIHLLLSTLAMMGLTFLIGFFVATVIKLIAYAADSFDFVVASVNCSDDSRNKVECVTAAKRQCQHAV